MVWQAACSGVFGHPMQFANCCASSLSPCGIISHLSHTPVLPLPRIVLCVSRRSWGGMFGRGLARGLRLCVAAVSLWVQYQHKFLRRQVSFELRSATLSAPPVTCPSALAGGVCGDLSSLPYFSFFIWRVCSKRVHETCAGSTSQWRPLGPASPLVQSGVHAFLLGICYF